MKNEIRSPFFGYPNSYVNLQTGLAIMRYIALLVRPLLSSTPLSLSLSLYFCGEKTQATGVAREHEQQVFTYARQRYLVALALQISLGAQYSSEETMAGKWLQLALALLVLFCTCEANNGVTLLRIKESFENGQTILHDWIDPTSYCSWIYRTSLSQHDLGPSYFLFHGKSYTLWLLEYEFSLSSDVTSLHRHRASRIMAFISLGCAIIILLVLVGAFLAFHRYKLHKLAKNPQPKLIILNSNLVGHVYDDIVRVTNNLSEDRIVGRGASCVVYMCAFPGRRLIAIKKLSSRPHDLKLFKKELEIVSNINHRNLVSLHGYSLSPSGHWLIYEYMEKGNLSSLLHGSTSHNRLDWDAHLKITIGAAQGLEYLYHDCKPKIIYWDVKTSNILIDNDGEAHVADFGFAKSLLISDKHTSIAIIGTVGYIDPKFAQTARLTEKLDVFSFGIVLLELLTRKNVFDKRCNLHQLIQERVANNITTVMDILDPTLLSTTKESNKFDSVVEVTMKESNN